jgi:hypothetical protein
VSEVPLPHHRRLVAERAEGLGQRDGLGLDAGGGVELGVAEVVVGAEGVAAGEEGVAGGGADGAA